MRFAVLTENHEFVENVIIAQAAQKDAALGYLHSYW